MRAHDSQAYRKMDVTSERISRILELREILLSFQTGFNLVNAAVVCAILESLKNEGKKKSETKLTASGLKNLRLVSYNKHGIFQN